MNCRNLVILLLLFCSTAAARARVSGYCENGGQVVVTNSFPSSTTVQQSYPLCTITVYLTGTLTNAVIYSDNIGTAKANPFTLTSGANGYWFFYVNNGTYDVRASGTGIATPFTWGAISAFDPFSFASVEDYGAFGDGTNSDCAGFNGAVGSGATTIFATQSSHYYLPCTVTMGSGQTIIWGAGLHTAKGFIIPDSSTLKTAGNVSFIGQGSSVTEIQQLAGANQNLIQSASFYSLFDTNNKFGVNGFTLKGITLDGNASNQTLATVNISGVSTATPIGITTSSAHGFTSGQVVCQKNIGGRPEADGCWLVTVTGAETYTLNGSASISPNAYTSGGVATNNHENCLALYGIGYIFEDVEAQNCAMNGIISGWDTEPADSYVSVLDRTTALITDARFTLNGFNGLMWHGPHDTRMEQVEGINNGSWGLFTYFSVGMSAASLNVQDIEFVAIYGDGAIFDGSTIIGTSITPTGPPAGPGLYIAPSGGGSVMTSVSLGGGIPPLEVNSFYNIIQGQCQNAPASTPCVQLDSGLANDFDLDCYLTNSGSSCFSVLAETGFNSFRTRGYLTNSVPFFASGHLPSTGDTVDVYGSSSASPLWQWPFQLSLTVPTGTAPFVVASTTPVTNLTTHPLLYDNFGNQYHNNFDVFGAVVLNGGSPSTATATWSNSFTSSGTFNCQLSLIGVASAAYSPAYSPVSGTSMTVTGPNGATTQWAYRCFGY